VLRIRVLIAENRSGSASRGEVPESMPYVEYDEVEAICKDCGRVFRSEDALAEHRTEAHSSEVKAPSEPAHPKTVKCSLCRQRFTTTAALQDHTRKAHSS